MRPFHLAFPVTDLVKLSNFMSMFWIAKLVEGHQTLSILISLDTKLLHMKYQACQDKTNLAMLMTKRYRQFHFGLVMDWENWHEAKDRLEKMEINFRIKPHIRYPGKIGEQATMFIDDPSGNAIELKSFQDDSRLFATTKDGANEVGGGYFRPSK